MARVFEALRQSSANDPDYAGRFLQAYDFTHVLELPQGYEQRALPPAPPDAVDQEPLPYIDADVEAEYANHDFDQSLPTPAPPWTAVSPELTNSMPPELRDEFKRLRNAIMLATKADHAQVFLVCGVAPGDGASFVARNLSLTLAEFDKLNIARFEVTAASETGSQITEGANSYQLTLRSAEAANLREITSSQGNVALNDLLRLCDLPAMMEKLRGRFDYVLIDAPAVSTHREVALLAAQTDGVILVAQQNETKCAQVEEARAVLQEAQAKILGVVLNRRRDYLPQAIARVV